MFKTIHNVMFPYKFGVVKDILYKNDTPNLKCAKECFPIYF